MSDLEELRVLVRGIIRDVLPQGLSITETVNLSTDEDLVVFVKRLLDLDPDEAERAAPGITLVDVSMIGAAGRIYLSGPAAEVRRAQREITTVLTAVAGRDQ